MLLTFASLRGEVTGRHPTAQNKERGAERVKREREREREKGRMAIKINMFSICVAVKNCTKLPHGVAQVKQFVYSAVVCPAWVWGKLFPH